MLEENDMNDEEMKRYKQFLKDQIDFMEKEKWYEGEKIKNDPGQEFLRKWIEHSASEFRKEWENKNGQLPA